MKCKHCAIDFVGSKGAFANHVRWCDKNPKVEEYKADNIARGKALGDERFGKYKKYEVTCNSCNEFFFVKEREALFPNKDVYFCSRKCSNSTGGRAKAAKYHTDDVASYVTVAWRHHTKECVVCGEKLIVAVHHMDENHYNNDPKNLVPLCPTHHQYMHSKYRVLIEDKVNKYIHDKWAMGLLG